MSKIDILLLTDNSLNTIGGSEESTKIIINGLKDNYKLGVIQPGEIVAPNIGVHYFPISKSSRLKDIIKNPVKFLKYILKLTKIINREKPKLIHTQAQLSFFIVSLLFKLKLISNEIKLIHTERGLYTKYNSFFKKIFLFFMTELNTLVTTTEFNMRYWQEALSNNNYELTYRIIENTAGELFETYNSTFERKKDNCIVIGFAGRYADWKNWPLAIEISEKLHKKIGNKLKVKMAVGCLDIKSQHETNKMFNYMTELLGTNFDGRINISLEEMDMFYYELDVFILTSDYNTESFGRTLVEAMSRKTIVFTTDAGGSVEVVGKKENVCDDGEEFGKKIIEVYTNTRMEQEEKKYSYERVKEKYSLENNHIKHNNLYNKLLEKR